MHFDPIPLHRSHQVDLYLEVDTPMVNFHDPNDHDNMPNTIAYLNALITVSLNSSSSS